MVGYFAFRLCVDFLKPEVRVLAGLSSIQWACIFMLLYYAPDVLRWLGGVRQLPRSEPAELEAPETARAAELHRADINQRSVLHPTASTSRTGSSAASRVSPPAHPAHPPRRHS